MTDKSTTYVFNVLYLKYKRLQALSEAPCEEINIREIQKLEKILQREAPYFLVSEGENFKNILN
jgi:hypothetical protein